MSQQPQSSQEKLEEHRYNGLRMTRAGGIIVGTLATIATITHAAKENQEKAFRDSATIAITAITVAASAHVTRKRLLQLDEQEGSKLIHYPQGGFKGNGGGTASPGGTF